MRNVFCFCNQKGGVGKTTSAINMATLLARDGFRTLIIDMDAQGNATSGLGEDKEKVEFTSYQLIVDKLEPKQVIQPTGIENLFIVPSNSDLSGAEIALVEQFAREFILRKQLEKVKDDFEYIILDCPPSLGLITVNCLSASDYIIIPLQCEYFAMEGLGQLLRTYQLVKDNLNPELEVGGVLLTMADMRTNLTQQVVQEVKTHFENKVFETVIPRSIKVSEAPSFGQPAVIYDSQNKGSRSYYEVTQEFKLRFPQERGAKPYSDESQDVVEKPVQEFENKLIAPAETPPHEESPPPDGEGALVEEKQAEASADLGEGYSENESKQITQPQENHS